MTDSGSVWCMVLNHQFGYEEGVNPGHFYTALSRANTLGDDDVNQLAIYFARIIHQLLVTLIGRRCSKYINVKRRYFWIDRIVSRGRLHKDLPTVSDVVDLTNWVQDVVLCTRNKKCWNKTQITSRDYYFIRYG